MVVNAILRSMKYLGITMKTEIDMKAEQIIIRNPAGATLALGAASVGIAGASALSANSKGRRAAKDAAEASGNANKQAMNQAKNRAAALKEASAKRSNQFQGDETKNNKSLLTAQKQKRRAVSGAAGTRLTGGKLGSPTTAGGATLLGQ